MQVLITYVLYIIHSTYHIPTQHKSLWSRLKLNLKPYHTTYLLPTKYKAHSLCMDLKILVLLTFVDPSFLHIFTKNTLSHSLMTFLSSKLYTTKAWSIYVLQQDLPKNGSIVMKIIHSDTFMYSIVSRNSIPILYNV